MTISHKKQLKKSRTKVITIDKQIISLFNKRFLYTKRIQILKRYLRLPISQKNREAELINQYSSLARAKKLPSDFIRDLFKIVFRYSKKTGIIKRWKKNQ